MSRSRKVILTALGVLVVGFVVLQFLPIGAIVPAWARTNPPILVNQAWDSPDTEQLVRTACFDCHSNETTWRWYAQIAPISWLVNDDVNEAREKLNFSEDSPEDIELHELIEEIEEGGMPLPKYTALHPDANLSDAQRDELIAGLRATFGAAASDDEDE